MCHNVMLSACGERFQDLHGARPPQTRAPLLRAQKGNVSAQDLP